jgi:hypothetical protein
MRLGDPEVQDPRTVLVMMTMMDDSQRRKRRKITKKKVKAWEQNDDQRLQNLASVRSGWRVQVTSGQEGAD